MLKAIPFLLLLVAVLPTSAMAKDDFVPRLTKAIDGYMRAHDACLRRVTPVGAAGGRTAEEIAREAIKTCRTTDPEVMAAARKVHGFPSVENFMAGNEEKITDFAVRLAKVRMRRSPWKFW